MDDITTDKFIKKVLDVLPIEGIEKLNTMIDNDEVSAEALNELLKEYNIDPIAVIEDAKEGK